jgi:hypothetical protein
LRYEQAFPSGQREPVFAKREDVDGRDKPGHDGGNDSTSTEHALEITHFTGVEYDAPHPNRFLSPSSFKGRVSNGGSFNVCNDEIAYRGAPSAGRPMADRSKS